MRQALERVRALVRAAAPDAVEVISYRMPAFRSEHGVFVCYAGFADHGSLFPGALVRFPALKGAMRPFVASTGTLQFTPGRPLPASLIQKLVRTRLAQLAAKAAPPRRRKRPTRRPRSRL